MAPTADLGVASGAGGSGVGHPGTDGESKEAPEGEPDGQPDGNPATNEPACSELTGWPPRSSP